MKKIVIIGAGQLGSRHLQSLNLVNFPLDITVIDPNKESLATAQSRFEATIADNKHLVTYTDVLAVNQPIDIAIVASDANHRRFIVEKLLAQTTVNHLVLEKLLFTQYQDYLDVKALLANKNTQTWVNCPMRMMPLYKTLNKKFGENPIRYQVSGSQYGLITNAIHYLDHLVYITGDNEFSLDTNYLDTQLINSKRAGYYEITGTLIAKFSKGSLAILHCDSKGLVPVQIEITDNKQRLICREWEQKAWETNQATDWKWQEIEAGILFQSSLTAMLVNDLIQKNTCDLPDFTTSVNTHLQLLNPLKSYIKQCGINFNIDYPFT